MTGSWSTAADGGLDSNSEAEAVAQLTRVESFDAFYQREFRLLVAFAHALTGSPTQAEDVAQEAMLAAYRRWDEIVRLDAPHAWVRRVCANIAVSFTRRRMVEARGLLRLRARRRDVVALNEEDATFWAEARRLPKRQAQSIVLCYVYGCSVGEIAQVLGCSEGSVKTHLSRGRSKLAARLGCDEGELS